MVKAAAFALVLAFPAVATADARTAKAEALFRQGRELVASGMFAEGCAAFDASEKLDPATTTVFNQADCREKNDQLATAWGLFLDAERQTRGASDDVGMRMHKVAVEHATKLEPRVSKLTIKVANPIDGLVVMRGAETVEQGEWGRALPIDGGSYTLVARVGDRQVWTQAITIKPESDARVVEVTPTTAAAPPATGGAEQPTPVVVASAPSKIGPIVATIGAGVLLGGALAFDLVGDSTYNQAVANHNMGTWNTANTYRYTAEGMLVAGVGCAGLAVYLWIADRGERSAHTMITPVATTNYAGVQLGGNW